MPDARRLIDLTVSEDQALTRTVGGYTVEVTPTVTVSLTAYTAGDCVGGKLTLANAVRVNGGTGVLQSLLLLDRANQKPNLTLLIYNADPTAATLTDNAALSNSTDDVKVIAKVNVTSGDWETINSKAYASLSGLGLVLKAASGSATLYAALLTTSTPTFVATTDLQLRLGILAD